MEDQDYLMFEAYLSKELSKDEAAVFEERLKNEPNFNEAFSTYKELSSFLEHKFENEEAQKKFKDNLKNISNVYFNKEETASTEKPKIKTVNFYKYAIAACIVVLFGIFTINTFLTPTYNDYSNHEIISLTVRGNNNDLLKTAENAFNNKNFAEAEDAFKNLLRLDKDNSELKLYRAIALIELNDFEIADSLLEALSSKKSAYTGKAMWYLALSKLKQKDYKASLKILKAIPKDADDYEEAKELINKLD